MFSFLLSHWYLEVPAYLTGIGVWVGANGHRKGKVIPTQTDEHGKRVYSKLEAAKRDRIDTDAKFAPLWPVLIPAAGVVLAGRAAYFGPTSAFKALYRHAEEQSREVAERKFELIDLNRAIEGAKSEFKLDPVMGRPDQKNEEEIEIVGKDHPVWADVW